NRGKIQRLKKEQKCETKQLTDTLGGANRLKKEGRANGGKVTEEKSMEEKCRKRKRRWKNGRESYGRKATVEMRRKAFKKRKNKYAGKFYRKFYRRWFIFLGGKLEN
uniref:Uncharacterized protein n=1 Tax=Cucumis melo TaxID=3656 RepID=A0A9I9EC62_CUCME